MHKSEASSRKNAVPAARLVRALQINGALESLSREVSLLHLEHERGRRWHDHQSCCVNLDSCSEICQEQVSTELRLRHAVLRAARISPVSARSLLHQGDILLSGCLIHQDNEPHEELASLTISYASAVEALLPRLLPGFSAEIAERSSRDSSLIRLVDDTRELMAKSCKDESGFARRRRRLSAMLDEISDKAPGTVQGAVSLANVLLCCMDGYEAFETEKWFLSLIRNLLSATTALLEDMHSPSITSLGSRRTVLVGSGAA